ncbi:MAG: RnfABCDGE type electron transport complex subunit C, partial [Sphaerochaetaceae bacterium]
MARLATFPKGGVHPNDKKWFTNSKAVEVMPAVSELIIPLSQHLGVPAKALKQKGDSVTAGEKIAEAAGFISASVHSPVNGTISEIKKVTLANNTTTDAFIITVDEQNPFGTWKKQPYDKLSKEELVNLVLDKGIVGAGGATFPSHVKLLVPKGKSVDTLVVNGVECEPYLTSDHRLMLENTQELLEGVMIVAKITEPKKIIIGVENNKVDAIVKLREEAIKLDYPIEIVPLKLKYPQGDEKQLLKATINREIPSGKLPLDVGAVVLNVGTAFAVYEAVVLRKPLIERIVTVSGEAFKEQKNLKVLIGTKVADLIEYVGGFDHQPDKLVSGGPMMGFAFYDEQSPITKGSGGLLALDDKKKKKVKQT